jgi:tetratricopeptide (TPR) repeat protein
VFPEGEVYKHHVLLGMDDTIRSNLEILLHNAETYNVNIYEIMALRKSLAFIYTDQLDYPKWGDMKIWLDLKEENREIDFHAMDEYQKSIYAWYILYQGMYEVFAIGDAESARKYLYKALDMAKQIQDIELQFTAYIQLAQIQAHRGDIHNARINIKHTEELVQNNQTKFDLSLLYYISARLLLLEGKYIEALEIVNRSIEYIKYLPHDQFSAPQYLMKARILLNLGNYEEAYKVANKTYEHSKKFFNYDRRLQGRILILLAAAENGLKMHKIALEHIMLAKKVFNDSPDKYDDPLAMIVEADIMVVNNNYSKAIELYKSVEKIFNDRYKDNMKIDVISILYTNIARAALKNNDEFLYKQFISKHEHVFGITHPRTIALYKQLIE